MGERKSFANGNAAPSPHDREVDAMAGWIEPTQAHWWLYA